MIYLDTCALMKLVHPEPETRALREFLSRSVGRQPPTAAGTAVGEPAP